MANKAPKSVSISDAIKRYLDAVKLSRSPHTMLAYRNAMQIFSEVLREKSLEPETTPIEKVSEDLITPLAGYLKSYANATEQLYLQAVKGFYLYIDSERLAEINQSRVVVLIKQRSRRPGIRFPQFPLEDIEALIT
ncbi:MAG: site-specific integrase, partial [Anaerolineales bacterium]|nr:site-specific integrase [Anaerolineales bacterium]